MLDFDVSDELEDEGVLQAGVVCKDLVEKEGGAWVSGGWRRISKAQEREAKGLERAGQGCITISRLELEGVTGKSQVTLAGKNEPLCVSCNDASLRITGGRV